MLTAFVVDKLVPVTVNVLPAQTDVALILDIVGAAGALIMLKLVLETSKKI